MNYVNQYNKNHYDRVIVLVPKGTLQNIRKEALNEGISASEYMRRLIPKRLLTEGNENDNSGVQE